MVYALLIRLILAKVKEYLLPSIEVYLDAIEDIGDQVVKLVSLVLHEVHVVLHPVHLLLTDVLFFLFHSVDELLQGDGTKFVSHLLNLLGWTVVVFDWTHVDVNA